MQLDVSHDEKYFKSNLFENERYGTGTSNRVTANVAEPIRLCLQIQLEKFSSKILVILRARRFHF